MNYIKEEELRDTGPIEIWLRIFSVPETLTIDGYREKYDKRQYWEKKFGDRAQMLFEYESKAMFYPEFSKLTGVAYAINDGEVRTLNGNEEVLLQQLNELLDEVDEIAATKKVILCGFNLYGHEIPYLRKRMVANGIKPNHYLRIAKIPVYSINNYIWDLNQLYKQTGFSAELPLIIECVLNERPDGYPYSSNNCTWLLDRTRKCWRKICEIFNP